MSVPDSRPVKTISSHLYYKLASHPPAGLSRHQPPLPPLRLLMATSLPNQAPACGLPTPLNGCMGGRQQPSLMWTLDTGSAISKLCAMPPPMPSHLFVACSTHVHTYILYKTGTCLACVLCTSGPHMPPPKSPARLDLHSCTIGVVHYVCMYILAHLSLLYQWAHFRHGPSKYLLQLCSVSGLPRSLARAVAAKPTLCGRASATPTKHYALALAHM